MAGVVFIVNVPKKEYELEIKNNKTNMFEKENFERNFKLINELKKKQNRKDRNGIVKRESIDSLQMNDPYIHRSKSEIGVTGGYLEEKTLAKLSWGDLKQVIRSRKNKLVINKKVRSVDILGDFHWDTPLENILSDVVSRLDISNVAWSSTQDDKFWQVIFSLDSGNLSEELLQVLRTFGIGSRYQSSVSLVPCALYYKSSDNSRTTSEIENAKLSHKKATNSSWSRFMSSVRARNNLAQVLHDVRANAGLTFDWVFLLVVAAIVAAVGLVENSTVILVASMLISPLMSPVTAGTLGTAVRDRSLQLMGVRNELLGLFVAMSVGFIVGLVISMVDESFGIEDEWLTHEMIIRCEYRSLWAGALVTVPTGAGVALALLGDCTAPLVGVAISAALLPPAVNAGLLWSMAVVSLVTPNDTLLTPDRPAEFAILGTTSLCLTLVNITCIFVAGVAVYKVKKVCPLERQDISWWRENKDSMQDSGGSTGDQHSDTTTRPSSLEWDVYNKWCNETLDGTQNIPKDSPPLIQSDTVTYRRRPSTKHLRALNLENYCHQNAQPVENYLHSETYNGETKEHEDHPKTELKYNVSKTNEQNNKLNTENEKLSYNNIGYPNDEEQPSDINNKYEIREGKDILYKKDEEYGIGYKNEDSTDIDYPIIEPTLSFTVGFKKHAGTNSTIDI